MLNSNNYISVETTTQSSVEKRSTLCYSTLQYCDPPLTYKLGTGMDFPLEILKLHPYLLQNHSSSFPEMKTFDPKFSKRHIYYYQTEPR